MSLLPVLIFAAAALVISVVIALWQSKTYLTEYFFFARYSLFFGAVLFLLPAVGPLLLPAMLANIFVMDWWGALLTGVAATLCSWTVVYTFLLTVYTIPVRCKLPFVRKQSWKVRAQEIAERLAARKYRLMGRWATLVSVALLLPLFFQVVRCADGPVWYNLGGLAGGVAVAFVLRVGAAAVRLTRWPEQPWNDQARPFRLVSDAGKLRRIFAVCFEIYRSFEIAPAMKVVHKRAAYFFVASLVFVIGLGWAYHPGHDWSVLLPAIVIVLCLLMLLTWVFGFIGFVFDKDRVPVVAVLVLAGVLLQFLVPNSHVYEATPWPDEVARVPADEVLAARIGQAGDQRPVVAVAASGGGIRAAYWTAFALERLAEEIPDVEQDIALISSVSGGSLGSMYFLENRFFAPRADGQASVASGTSSLSATVWGFTYLEGPRLLVGSALNPYDRGWAQEVTWSHLMSDPGRSLSGVVGDVKDGKCPLPVFNACLQETGQRYVISPALIKPPTNDTANPESGMAAAAGGSDEPQPKNAFQDFVGDIGGDLPIVTAARLSATFPYVSPQARADVNPPLPDADDRPPFYHAADGGYYDNSGLLTAIEILDRYLERAETKPARIALIEIRAAPGDFAGLPPAASGGLLTDLIGPVQTVLNVQFEAQSARNRQEIRWLGQLWKRRSGVELNHFIFYLSGGPLSWHLTEHEKELIRIHWPNETPDDPAEVTEPIRQAQAHNSKHLKLLKEFVGVE